MSTRSFAIIAMVGCVAVTDTKLQPGIIYDMAQRPLDPEPTADPNRLLQAQPFAEGSGSVNRKEQLALAVAATLAAMLAGMMPAIFFVGKFDENRWFRR